MAVAASRLAQKPSGTKKAATHPTQSSGRRRPRNAQAGASSSQPSPTVKPCPHLKGKAPSTPMQNLSTQLEVMPSLPDLPDTPVDMPVVIEPMWYESTGVQFAGLVGVAGLGYLAYKAWK